MLNAGIVGAGILGCAHAENLRDHPDVTVRAVADIRADAAQRLASQLGAEAYTGVADMLQQCPLDLIIVATPDPYHREPTLAAIAAGVPNILQEKPLATNLADARAIYEAVESSGTRLFVNYANRSAPMDIATAYTIREGLLGQIVYGEVRLDDNISVPTALWGTRSRDWAEGSSTAHFLLSHVIDLLRWYLHPAEIKQVYAVKQQTVLGYTLIFMMRSWSSTTGPACGSRPNGFATWTSWSSSISAFPGQKGR